MLSKPIPHSLAAFVLETGIEVIHRALIPKQLFRLPGSRRSGVIEQSFPGQVRVTNGDKMFESIEDRIGVQAPVFIAVRVLGAFAAKGAYSPASV